MSAEDTDESGIAIVGMSGAFPDARDIDALWSLLKEGREAMHPLASRTHADMDEDELGSKNFVNVAAMLADMDCFDAQFFDYNARQAAELDPQQRVFLECAWHTLEDAGCNPDTFDGAIGVFAGAGINRYCLTRMKNLRYWRRFADFYAEVIASDKDYLTTRVSYKLNLTGPSIAIQTACSTSLVAVHVACQSLRNRECDLALAGGVSLQIPQDVGYVWQEGGILSKDGHCRPYDAQASGTVPGSGAGVVALRRLSDALKDGHSIYAVIQGSAVNNDGARKAGFTAPGIEGQEAVLARAQSGLDPRTIEMLEGHGTATNLGDAVELRALASVFRRRTSQRSFCALGSIKSNLGHLDAAAGVAGLIKAALCLKYGQLVPSLNFRTANPVLEADSPFYVNTSLRDWPRQSWPRRAGVSSFGIGGTNAHVVLQEAPMRERQAAPERDELFLLSAKTPTALSSMRSRLAAFLTRHTDVMLADVAYTLQVGRKAFAYRCALLASNRAQLLERLEGSGPATVGRCEESASAAPLIVSFPDTSAALVTAVASLANVYPSLRARLEHLLAAAPVEYLSAQCSHSLLFGFGENNPRSALLGILGELWCSGAKFDWTGPCPSANRHRVSLPGYPFERQRYWIEETPPSAAATAIDTAPGGISEALSNMIDRDTPQSSLADVEEEIKRIWEDVLGTPGIGSQDDLYDVDGGDSLAAMGILARVREIFDTEVPLRRFLGSHRTIAKLAALIATQRTKQQEPGP